MMKRSFSILAVVLLLVSFPIFFSASEAEARSSRPQPTPTPKPTPTPRPTPVPTSAPGPATTELKLKITGVVDRCVPGRVEGTEVYISGKSFFLKTGSTGEFNFYGVPNGAQEIVFGLPGLAPYKTNVTVGSTTTNMGAVNVCPDGDEDGFNVQDDCRDTDNNVYPGAPEVCNYMDDDCDEERDEGLIPNSQDVSIQIISPVDGSPTNQIRSMGIYAGGSCTPDFVGDPESSIAPVIQAPDGFVIRAAFIITKPSGNEVNVFDYNPGPPVYSQFCTPLCSPEPCCDTIANTSSSGVLDYYFDEFGTYIVTAIIFGENDSILAQDSITLINPEPVSE